MPTRELRPRRTIGLNSASGLRQLVVAAVLLVGLFGLTSGDVGATGLLNGGSDPDYQACILFDAMQIATRCGSLGTKAARTALAGAIFRCHDRGITEGDQVNGTGTSLRVLVPDLFAPWLVPTLRRFSESYGIPLDLDVAPTERTALLDAIHAEVATRSPSQQHALWLHAAAHTHQLASEGLLADLGGLLSSFAQDELQWSDVSQLYRLQLATFMGEPVSIPLDGGMAYLFSRRDVLGAMGVQVPPESWTELEAFISRYQAYREAASPEIVAQLPPYALCIAPGVGCRRLTYVQAVWTSIAQTLGIGQGVNFDTNTLEPLVDSPALLEALRVMALFVGASSPHEPDETCTHGSLAFVRGRCALALGGWVPQLRMFVDPEAKGTVPQTSIEITRLPGSEVVWPREGTDQMVPCTPQLCPYASLVASTVPAGNGTVTERLVNFAPQSLLSTLTGSINSKAPATSQLLAFALLAHLASPDRYELGEPVSPMLVVTPVRDRLLLRDDVLTGPGYDLGLQHVAATTALEFQRNHPNRGWPLRMAGMGLYNNMLLDLLDEAQRPGVDLLSAVAQAKALLMAHYPPSFYLSKYLASLGDLPKSPSPGSPSPSPAAPGQPPASTTNGNQGQILQGASAGSVALVLILATVAAVWVRRRRLRAPRSTSYQPKVSDVAVITVTDIEGSTTLWEEVAPEAMARALQLHHVVVRRLLVRHGGYESATEGDSFILAFAAAHKAVAFGTELQGELLAQAWPQELLQHPAAKPVWTALRAGFPFTRPTADVPLSPEPETSTAEQLAELLETRGRQRSFSTGRCLSTGVAGAQALDARLLSLLRGSLESAQPSSAMPGAHAGSSRRSQTDPLGSQTTFHEPTAQLLPPPVAAAPTTHLPPSFSMLSSGVDFLPAIKSGKDLGPEEFAALDTDFPERSRGGALGPAGDVQPSGPLSVYGKLRIRRPERLLSLGGALSRSTTFDALGTDEEGGQSRASPASALSPASHKTARTMLAFLSQARADGFVTDASCSQRPVVMFRGLRVRVGVTCARLTAAELQYNTAAARMVLGGPALAAAKALADLAHGGQVLLSCRAHEQLRKELPGSNGRPSGVLLLKMGTFQQQPANALGSSCNGAEPFLVLWATSPSLSPRLASWPPLRLPQGLGTLNDVYCAPVDRVSYVVVQIPAYRSLMAWDQQVARESLDLLYRTAQAALHGAESKGFQVETAVVADELHFAFGEAAAAVRWVEGLRRELLAAPWPQALLDHELGEAVEADSAELPPPLPAAAVFNSPHVSGAGRWQTIGPTSAQNGADGACTFSGTAANTMQRTTAVRAGSCGAAFTADGLLAGRWTLVQQDSICTTSSRRRSAEYDRLSSTRLPTLAEPHADQRAALRDQGPDAQHVPCGAERGAPAWHMWNPLASQSKGSVAGTSASGISSCGSGGGGCSHRGMPGGRILAAACGSYDTAEATCEAPVSCALPAATTPLSVDASNAPLAPVSLAAAQLCSLHRHGAAAEPAGSPRSCEPQAGSKNSAGRAASALLVSAEAFNPLESVADPLEPPSAVPHHVLLLRGLRIRAGIATGRATWTASPKTHALVYSGRVVAAASKLASKASCGKVLCDSATQAAAASAAAVASTTSGPQPPASGSRPGTPRPQTESILSGRLVFTPVRAGSPRALSFSRPWRRKPQGEILTCGLQPERASVGDGAANDPVPILTGMADGACGGPRYNTALGHSFSGSLGNTTGPLPQLQVTCTAARASARSAAWLDAGAPGKPPPSGHPDFSSLSMMDTPPRRAPLTVSISAMRRAIPSPHASSSPLTQRRLAALSGSSSSAAGRPPLLRAPSASRLRLQSGAGSFRASAGGAGPNALSPAPASTSAMLCHGAGAEAGATSRAERPASAQCLGLLALPPPIQCLCSPPMASLELPVEPEPQPLAARSTDAAASVPAGGLQRPLSAAAKVMSDTSSEHYSASITLGMAGLMLAVPEPTAHQRDSPPPGQVAERTQSVRGWRPPKRKGADVVPEDL